MTYSLSDTNSIPPFILMEPDYLCKEVFFHFVESIYMGEWKQEYEYTQKKRQTVIQHPLGSGSFLCG